MVTIVIAIMGVMIVIPWCASMVSPPPAMSSPVVPAPTVRVWLGVDTSGGVAVAIRGMSLKLRDSSYHGVVESYSNAPIPLSWVHQVTRGGVVTVIACSNMHQVNNNVYRTVYSGTPL